MRAADGITASIRVDTDPATAFEAFTAEIDRWWGSGPKYRCRQGSTMSLEPGVGGRLLETFDAASGECFAFGTVLVWDPPLRLELEWRGPNFEPGQKTRVGVTFEAAKGGTQVTVEHSGWDGLPQDHPVRHGLPDDAFYRMWGGWWSSQLGALRVTAGRAEPRPDPANDPLFS